MASKTSGKTPLCCMPLFTGNVSHYNRVKVDLPTAKQPAKTRVHFLPEHKQGDNKFPCCMPLFW